MPEHGRRALAMQLASQKSAHPFLLPVSMQLVRFGRERTRDHSCASKSMPDSLSSLSSDPVARQMGAGLMLRSKVYVFEGSSNLSGTGTQGICDAGGGGSGAGAGGSVGGGEGGGGLGGGGGGTVATERVPGTTFSL